jgi:hypothetical protein
MSFQNDAIFVFFFLKSIYNKNRVIKM